MIFLTSSVYATNFGFAADQKGGACRTIFSPTAGQRFLATSFEGTDSITEVKFTGGRGIKGKATAAAANLLIRQISTRVESVSKGINDVAERTSLVGLLKYAASKKGPGLNLFFSEKDGNVQIQLEVLVNRAQILYFVPQAMQSKAEAYLPEGSTHLPITLGPYNGKFTHGSLNAIEAGHPFKLVLDSQHTAEFRNPGAVLSQFMPEYAKQIAALLNSPSNMLNTAMDYVTGGTANQRAAGNIEIHRIQEDVMLDIPGSQ